MLKIQVRLPHPAPVAQHLQKVVGKPRSILILCPFVVTVPGISATPTEENLRYFQVIIIGPMQSPFEGELHFSFVRLQLRSRSQRARTAGGHWAGSVR